jgi:hypothetical protein
MTRGCVVTTERTRKARPGSTDTGKRDIPPDGVRSAVINPYALAEVVAGRRIPWHRLDDRAAVLEQVLQMPYEELFDPANGSPLYAGLRLNRDGELEPDKTGLEVPESPAHANDYEAMPPEDLRAVETIGDLKRYFDDVPLERIPVARSRLTERGRLELELDPGRRSTQGGRGTVLTRDVLQTVAHALVFGATDDWTPPNGSWQDAGRYFNEAAEYFDPVQGAVANCYLIAAMASVAWARPFMVSHMTRATGGANEQFTNLVRFRDTDAGNTVRDIEVTDATPTSSAGGPIYCRSSELGEIWPAVYEKAFAKWKTGSATDRPDITATAWGDCVRAAAELTGLTREYHATSGLTADQLWDRVRQNSLGGKTFNPVVAATYGSGASSPDKVVYADANLVASHCYSVLGWAYRNQTRYLILRNPWGNTEATLGTLGGTEFLYDVSWWRPIVLADPDGVFAITASTFKSYFATLGVVR